MGQFDSSLPPLSSHGNLLTSLYGTGEKHTAVCVANSFPYLSLSQAGPSISCHVSLFGTFLTKSMQHLHHGVSIPTHPTPPLSHGSSLPSTLLSHWGIHHHMTRRARLQAWMDPDGTRTLMCFHFFPVPVCVFVYLFPQPCLSNACATSPPCMPSYACACFFFCVPCRQPNDS